MKILGTFTTHMHKNVKKMFPKELQRFLPKETEEILIEASQNTQEKRNKIVEKNIERISVFLDSEDAVPTRTQILSRNKKRLDGISDVAYDGKKPSSRIGGDWLQGDSEYPLDVVLYMIQRTVEDILYELKNKEIKATEIEKGSSYYNKREKGNWTKETIQNLPLDWVKSAIITYYTESEKRGKDDSCSKKDGVISASEFKECQKIIKLGSVKRYLKSLNKELEKSPGNVEVIA